MLKPERKNSIVSLVNQVGFVSVGAISQQLGVSEMTIRRDLEELAEEGCLTRVHGGARSIGSNHGVMVAREYTTPEKHRYHMGEKREIARSASQLVTDGETVFLGAGTTCEALARELVHRHIRIVSNSFLVFDIVKDSESAQCCLVGGDYRSGTGAFVGVLAERSIALLGIDKAFIGVNGLSEGTVYGSNSLEGSVFSLTMRKAEKCYILTDSSKIGLRDFFGFYQLAAVDAVVTEHMLSAEKRAEIEKYTHVVS